jgi:formate C-acetyltransferase
LEGCIEQATDYTAGGARYNPSGITLVGLGTLVDALEAIRVAVYEEQWLSLDRLLAVVSANWEGEEALRQRILHHPRRYGHGQAATDALASGISAELTAFAHTLPNERGAHFQASYFVYYAFKWQASNTAATPDGRRHGDMFTQGIAPNRIAAPQSLTDVFKTLSSIDWTGAPGNAVLDIQLPVGNALTPQVIAATMRTFARMGGPTLQLNCVSPAVLRDAQARPEQHEDLVVRISGLSACFVQLNRDVQDEIIDRAVMAVG